MTNRLTVNQRKLLADKVVTAAYEKKFADMKQREHDLCRRVRDSLIPKHQREAIDALPRNFFMSTGYSTMVKVADAEGKSIGWLDCDTDLRVPHFMRNGVQIIEEASLVDDLKALFQEAADLKVESNAYRSKTLGVIESFKSTAKLLEAWPTLREVMGEKFFSSAPAKNPVVTTVNELDETLQAARPFETEAKAA